jgi:hypothetical protein
MSMRFATFSIVDGHFSFEPFTCMVSNAAMNAADPT